jgi:hypothetical protein
MPYSNIIESWFFCSGDEQHFGPLINITGFVDALRALPKDSRQLPGSTRRPVGWLRTKVQQVSLSHNWVLFLAKREFEIFF